MRTRQTQPRTAAGGGRGDAQGSPGPSAAAGWSGDLAAQVVPSLPFPSTSPSLPTIFPNPARPVCPLLVTVSPSLPSPCSLLRAATGTRAHIHSQV